MKTPAIQCPMCNARMPLPVGQPIAPGTQVRCPGCGSAITLSATQPAPRPPAPVARAKASNTEPPLPRPARADRPAPRPARPAEPVRAPVARRSWLLPLLGAALAVGIVATTIVVATTGSRKKDDPPKVVENRPAKEDAPAQQEKPSQAASPEQTRLAAETFKQPARPEPAWDGQGLTDEVLERVKKATVYLRVVSGEGVRGTGSGFFESGTGLILTNAHVIGMLEPGGPFPKAVEAILNSGKSSEVVIAAKVVAVDRNSDLAFLQPDLGRVPSGAEPPRLMVENAARLRETQRVYVFGFPFGEKLGKNITVSETTVSSLREDKGALDRVQVNGGMHPGNSGGPVVDSKGNVVGVAVSGITGTQINFAIPGEKVKTLLGSPFTTVGFGDWNSAGEDRLSVLVQVRVLDPRNQVRGVELEWWVGRRQVEPAPPASAQRQVLDYTADTGMAAETLRIAEPPDGQVLWVRPRLLVRDGSPVLQPAVYERVRTQIRREPVRLRFRPQGDAPLWLSVESRLKLGSDDSEHAAHFTARFTESVRTAKGKTGATLILKPESATFELDSGPKRADGPAGRAAGVLKALAGLTLELPVDSEGGVSPPVTKLDGKLVPEALRPTVSTLGGQLARLVGGSLPLLPDIELPPGVIWDVRHNVVIDALVDFKPARANLTYRYRGLRTQQGRAVAVLGAQGQLSDPDGGDKVRGTLEAETVVDVATGRLVRYRGQLHITKLGISAGGETRPAQGVVEVELSREPFTKEGLPAPKEKK